MRVHRIYTKRYVSIGVLAAIAIIGMFLLFRPPTAPAGQLGNEQTADTPLDNPTSNEADLPGEVMAAQDEQITADTVTTQSAPRPDQCSDCTFAAVDKQYPLARSYVPIVEGIGRAGGGSLTPDAAQAIRTLFAAAQNEGIALEIISSYRSFATQEATFNYWVSTETARGLSQAEAETQANTYSARAGQSEHQLGTTADLACVGCEPFNETQNTAVYSFIAQHAHKYGFVVSYPIGQESLTGYTHEPWHIRWIGVEYATQLFDTGYITGNGNYLAKFLRESGLSGS